MNQIEYDEESKRIVNMITHHDSKKSKWVSDCLMAGLIKGEDRYKTLNSKVNATIRL